MGYCYRQHLQHTYGVWCVTWAKKDGSLSFWDNIFSFWIQHSAVKFHLQTFFVYHR